MSRPVSSRKERCPYWAAGLAPVVALVLTACTSGTGDTQATTTVAVPMNVATSTTTPAATGWSYPSSEAEREAIGAKILTCMEEAGFPGREHPDGGYQFDYPPDQAEPFQDALERCETDSFGFNPNDVQPSLSDSQLKAYYEALLETATCLEGLGYEPPAAPSVSTFVESGGAIWHPYSVFGQGGVAPSAEEWRQVNEACPQPSPYG
ncbi:MAG TPA: hypothetical protein ENH00_01080 [Actinobacteria bacterium]|nr:hypothetical protein BMS3Bbin01_02321 [bacterium BMS3Bbin01]HDH24771.1 hypothetical protein [Actinomycetota bacterium]